MCGSLGIAPTVRWLGKRRVLVGGMILQVLTAPMLAADTSSIFVAGLCLQVVGISAAEIALNLFALERIPRRELSLFEPQRLFYAGIGWTAGPWLGVVLWEQANWMPYSLSALLAVVAIVHFLVLNFTDSAKPGTTPALPNPLIFIPRFFSQPRLRLAWFLAFTRSSWWTVFYIYAPIYLVSIGASNSMAAAVLILVPFIKFIPRRM